MENVFRGNTGITYPLLVNGGAVGSLYMVDRQYVVIDPEGIIRHFSERHDLNVEVIRGVIDEYLPLDEPEFEFTMQEEIIEYANLTSGDSSHWLFPYDFHATVTSLSQADTLSLVFNLTPVEFEDDRRQTSICFSDLCYPPTHGPQTRTGDYAPLAHDTTVKFSVYWQVSDSMGLPQLADLIGDYIFDVSIYEEDDPGEVIGYRLQLIDTFAQAVVVRPVPIPTTTRLLSNYPNPFNPSTEISFVIEQAGPVTVSVHDVLGRRVAELVNGSMAAGNYSAHWDARSSAGVALPSGSYWVRLSNVGHSTMHRIVLIR